MRVKLSVNFLQCYMWNKNYCPAIWGLKIKSQSNQNMHCNMVNKTKAKGPYENNNNMKKSLCNRIIQNPKVTCSGENVTKVEIYWGLYHIHNWVFLTYLWIFVTCLEIIFYINHYFLVCTFKYRTSLRINSGLEIWGYCFYSNNLRINSTKNRTAETATA